MFHVTGNFTAIPNPAQPYWGSLKWSDKVTLSASGMKNWRTDRATTAQTHTPDKLQRWSPLYISNQSLDLSRRNLQQAFRCTFPKSPWRLTCFPSAPSSLEGLPLSRLHTIQQTTDEGRLISKKHKCHQNLIGIVCMFLYNQPHIAQILPTRSKKIFLSQHQLKLVSRSIFMFLIQFVQS